MPALMLALGAAKLAAGIVQGVNERNKQKQERERLKKAKKRMRDFEANRQPVINKADEIRAMKDQLSNPFANLPVATQAAEMQIEQTDQALANTLDTIRATGSGAGGATALAQAAAQSKAKVSAGLEQQEAANAKAAAQGEANLQAQKQAIESAAISEEISAYGRQEDRDIVQLDRMQQGIDDRRGNIEAYRGASTDAFMGGVGGLGEGMMQTDFTELGN
jgi:chromosome segregation ATPase